VSKKSIAGPLYLCFIGLAVLLMGALFMGLLWKSYVGAKETRAWPVVEGVILDASVAERKLGPQIPQEYSVGLSYSYEFEGEPYQGDHLTRRENPWFKDRERVEFDLKELLMGTRVEVFVNPEEPGEAVLRHESKAGGYSIWFPGLFVVAGLGILLSALRKIFSRAERVIAS
jgi:hypothetical protein